MAEPWIKDFGTCAEAEARQKMLAWQKEHPACKVLLFYTDAFAPCMEAAEADETHLLEVRCFTPDAELWLHRSCIGQDFHWRIADDAALRENVKDLKPAFFANPENYRLEQVQKLDIDLNARPQGTAPAGCRLLKTTGGCTYALPITDENAIRLVGYMGYSQDKINSGAGKLKDFRYAEFIRKAEFGGEEEASCRTSK